MKPRRITPPGYRLPDDTRLGTVTLQVADLSRSIAYYEDILGLAALDRNGAEAVLGPAHRRKPVIALRERPGIHRVPRGGLLGLYHFAILLPDRAALGRFIAHLAASRVSAGSADHAVSEAVYLTDPDGLGIEVYSDRPRESWSTDSNGQLHMITAPLDLPSLVEAGRGQSWAGMPAATVLGHVHLHVGDLDAAAAFYHSALGFDKTVWTYPGALFLSAGGYHHHLGTNTWSAGPPADDAHARLLSWDIVVPRAADASAAADSVRAAGYEVDELIGGAWRAVDPWGTPLRITTDTSTTVQ